MIEELKKKKATDAQVISLIFHTLSNAEVIGVNSMDITLLFERVEERLDNLLLEYTKQQLQDSFNELCTRGVIQVNEQGRVEII